MNSIDVKSGVCLGFGGTNARFGEIVQQDVQNFQAVSTPEHAGQFFKWMALHTLDAADNGANWVVAGFPGPVSADGKFVGPMANVGGMTSRQFDISAELRAAEPATAELFEEGFQLVAVNDGELAAQAAALKIGNGQYDKVAALIVGTGVGAGIVQRNNQTAEIYRADRSNPAEIGHIALSDDPTDTYENLISGPALLRRYGEIAQNLDAQHPAWPEVGKAIGRMATTLSLMHGANLVVPCGGIGANALDKYQVHLQAIMEDHATRGNGTQKLLMPNILPVAAKDAQVFELFGAEGVMRDFLTR